MALQSMTAIANITLQAAAPEVVFGNIPSGYRDLVLVINGSTTGEGVPRARVNNDSGNNYVRVEMFTGNAGTFSATATGDRFQLGQTGTGFSGTRFASIAQFFDYSATDKHKTVLVRHNDDDVRGLGAIAQRWANTAAITSITCLLSANSYAAGCTFSLYGRIA